MALMETPVCDFGHPAIDFLLTGVDGKQWSLTDCRGERGLLVMFICNHCPFVKAVHDRLVEDVKQMQQIGIGVVAIMPNETENYPDDSFENMQHIAKHWGFTFPYLIDENQETARAYGTVCTPDFFGYNADLELQYRGRLDSGRPNNPPPPGYCHDLLEAMTRIADTGEGPAEQLPSAGCSIKWRE